MNEEQKKLENFVERLIGLLWDQLGEEGRTPLTGRLWGPLGNQLYGQIRNQIKIQLELENV